MPTPRDNPQATPPRISHACREVVPRVLATLFAAVFACGGLCESGAAHAAGEQPKAAAGKKAERTLQTGANETTAAKGDTLSLDDVRRVWPDLVPYQQFAAIDQLIAAGAHDDAEALLAATDYSKPTDQLTKRFFIGLIRRAQGQNAEAVATFRAILADHPEFSRVRMALAATLYQTEDDEAARHHLELVLADTASNPNLSNTVRGYINAIDGRRRWDASAYVTIAPSTNFNQGSTDSIVYLTGPDGNPLPFELDKDNRKRSGVGVAAGLQASYRQPLADQLDLILSGGLNTKTYKDSDFNDALIDFTIGPRLRLEWGYLGLYGLAEQRFYANEAYSFSYGGMVSATVRLSGQDMAFADVSCLKRDFESDWQDSDLSYQDGHTCSLNGRLEHAFSSTTLLRVLGGAGRERTGRDHLDNDSWYAGGGLSQELPWGVSIYAQALYTSRDYDGKYPGAGERRLDDRWDFSMNLTKRDWILFDMAPMIQYIYTVNGSSVPFFDYDAHGVNLTLTKRF